jgi:hypothetical protein
MFIRKSILSVALLAAVAGTAFATSGTTPNNGELGATTHAMAGTVTREQVKRELAEWRNNPVSGGWREVGGERGWEQEQHRYDFRNGQFVHVDKIPHGAPKPALASAQDKREFAALYGSGS